MTNTRNVNTKMGPRTKQQAHTVHSKDKAQVNATSTKTETELDQASHKNRRINVYKMWVDAASDAFRYANRYEEYFRDVNNKDKDDSDDEAEQP